MTSPIIHDLRIYIATEVNPGKATTNIWISLEDHHHRLFALNHTVRGKEEVLCHLYEGFITALHQAALREAASILVEDRDGRLTRNLGTRIGGTPEVVALRGQARQLLGIFSVVTLRQKIGAAA